MDGCRGSDSDSCGRRRIAFRGVSLADTKLIENSIEYVLCIDGSENSTEMIKSFTHVHNQHFIACRQRIRNVPGLHERVRDGLKTFTAPRGRHPEPLPAATIGAYQPISQTFGKIVNTMPGHDTDRRARKRNICCRNAVNSVRLCCQSNDAERRGLDLQK